MKKIGIISLALVLALGSLGVGYAHWSDQLYINGDIEAGSLMVGFTDVICVERYYNPDPPPEYLDGEWLGKDVGKCEASYEGYRQDKHTLKEGYDTVTFTITDAYPSYCCHITFVIENLGTIPVIFEAVTVSDPTGDLTYDPVLMALVDADGTPIINCDFVNLIGVQLDYCQNTKAEVDLHFKQDAKECHTYTIEVTIDAIQWNKYVP